MFWGGDFVFESRGFLLIISCYLITLWSYVVIVFLHYVCLGVTVRKV